MKTKEACKDLRKALPCSRPINPHFETSLMPSSFILFWDHAHGPLILSLTLKYHSHKQFWWKPQWRWKLSRERERERDTHTHTHTHTEKRRETDTESQMINVELHDIITIMSYWCNEWKYYQSFFIHLDVDICEHKCFFVSQYSHIEFGFPWWLTLWQMK